MKVQLCSDIFGGYGEQLFELELPDETSLKVAIDLLTNQLGTFYPAPELEGRNKATALPVVRILIGDIVLTRSIV